MEKRAETVGDFTPPTDLPALIDIGREEEDWGGPARPAQAIFAGY